jgi:hypothetical protein
MTVTKLAKVLGLTKGGIKVLQNIDSKERQAAPNGQGITKIFSEK